MTGGNVGVLPIGSRAAAMELATQLLRIRRLGGPEQLLTAPPDVVAMTTSRFPGVRIDTVVSGRCDFAVIGGVSSTVAADAFVLPGVPEPARYGTRSVVQCSEKPPRPQSTVLLVPGAGVVEKDGRYRLSRSALDRLRVATTTACADDVVAVVLSGWSPYPGQDSEAEQLRDSWPNPPRALLIDTAARTSAENMLHVVLLASAIPGVTTVRVVSSWSNAIRDRLLFRLAGNEGRSLAFRQSTAWGRAHWVHVRAGLVGLLFMRRHLAAGRRRLGLS